MVRCGVVWKLDLDIMVLIGISRRFYGCPTLSPTCVNFLRMYDPLMCQRLVQIIPGLLRSHNELEEIIAMVEEKRHKLLKFLIIGWVVFWFDVYCTM
ncbi:hypothetical protein Tco_0512141 [Tanacetum coccineum]